MSGAQPPVPALAAGELSDPLEGSVHSKQSSTRGLGRWRRPVGLLLLLATVFLWTASNFLQSTIFADNTYSKPFFVTYVNSAIFVAPLAPILIWRACRYPGGIRQWWRSSAREHYAPLGHEETDGTSRHTPDMSASQELLLGEQAGNGHLSEPKMLTACTNDEFTVSETARLALQFSLIWYGQNCPSVFMTCH